MAAIGRIAKAGFISPLAAALGAFSKKKAAPAPLAPSMAVARSNSVLTDALSQRRGAAANQVTGAGGVESSTRSKKTLMGQ